MTKASLQSINNLCKRHRIPQYETKKLWWGKYAYKVTVYMPQPRRRLRPGRPIDLTPDEIEYNDALATKNALRRNKGADIKFRLEWDHHQMYATNLDDVENIIKKMANHSRCSVTEVHVPGDSTSYEYEKGVEFCNNLPFKKYKYKVFLYAKGRTKPGDKTKNIKKWIDSVNDKSGDEPYRLSNQAANQLASGSWLWSGCYMYALDDKYLTMFSLKASDFIQRTIEYRKKKNEQTSS